MSDENVEVVKRVIDALNRRDVDGWADCTTSDFELFPAMCRAVERGSSYRGRVGIEAYVETVSDTCDEFCLFADEFRDLGDRVLVLRRMEGRGKGSGASVDAPYGAINDFRDGKIVRIRSYLDHGEALRAAGTGKLEMSANLDLVRSPIG